MLVLLLYCAPCCQASGWLARDEKPRRHLLPRHVRDVTRTLRKQLEKVFKTQAGFQVEFEARIS